MSAATLSSQEYKLHILTKKRAAQVVADFLGKPLPKGYLDQKESDASDTAGTNGDKKRKKRKSRWNTDDGIAPKPKLPTVIPSHLSREERELYLKQLRIEELSQYIRANYVPPETERSPSPEPVYNQAGQRLNTRDLRYKLKWEAERHTLVQLMISSNPNYIPPVDYRPPDYKVEDRIPIPQEEFPDINFMGLIIGPRGKTLKQLEGDTGAKIMIRGRGSVKEGKANRGGPYDDEDEPLYALITAQTPEGLKKAVEEIKIIIRTAIECPEEQNELKKTQLRELALLNGTLREEDMAVRCRNCGATEHRTWQCEEKKNATNELRCTVCGGVGHFAKDCRFRGQDMPKPDAAQIDTEYMNLMAELGEGPKPTMGGAPGVQAWQGQAVPGGWTNYPGYTQNQYGYGPGQVPPPPPAQ